MFHLLLRIALAVTGALVLVAGLILAQPSDNTNLLAALPNRTGCPAPCWQGIRPGETTLGYAVSLLSQNHWVDEMIADDARIEWTWSGKQPPIIDAGQPGALFVRDGVVRSIRIPLKISIGDLATSLGDPYWHSTNHAAATAITHLSYPREYLMLAITTHCPANRTTFWRSQPEVTLQDSPASGSPLTPALLGRSVAC